MKIIVSETRVCIDAEVWFEVVNEEGAVSGVGRDGVIPK